MSSTLDWIASIRGRFGYLVTPNLLAYATGGAAWGGFHYTASEYGPIPGYSTIGGVPTPFDKTAGGYAVGGGLEWAMTTNWLVRAEYLFYRFKTTESVVAPIFIAGYSSSYYWSNTNVSVARAGLSYKF